MHLLQASANGNPNIGLYLHLTDKYCIAGLDIPARLLAEIKQIIKVPIIHMNICGTSLVGVFCSGNSECLLMPEIVFDTELRMLEKNKIKYAILNSHLTALGNNILANDIGCLVNPEFSAVQKKAIRTHLRVNLKPGTIAEMDNVGSLAVVNNKFGAVHHDVSDMELNTLQKLLDIKLSTATINLGNPFISSGLVCNMNGFIIGDQSTGVEINNIDECFGYLDN